jgi:predicted metal-dependent hydrolase
VTSITVRRPVFEWPTDLPLLPIPSDPGRSCDFVALSFTLPYLEPYLIRTMRVAAKEVESAELRAEMKAFSGQEAQHYQQHARINDVVRSQLSDRAAVEMRLLEDELEADYRRFSSEKSLAFNLAYAEGFEAMTFSLARSAMGSAGEVEIVADWANLIAWHLAEEIEHRTVTFDAYDQIVGRYAHRVAVGSWAQVHFLGFLLRMAAVLQRELVDPEISLLSVVWDSAKRNWRNGTLPGTLKAALPTYDPRKVALSDHVRLIAASQGVDLD